MGYCSNAYSTFGIAITFAQYQKLFQAYSKRGGRSKCAGEIEMDARIKRGDIDGLDHIDIDNAYGVSIEVDGVKYDLSYLDDLLFYISFERFNYEDRWGYDNEGYTQISGISWADLNMMHDKYASVAETLELDPSTMKLYTINSGS